VGYAPDGGLAAAAAGERWDDERLADDEPQDDGAA
jgi:hypothetical protein